MKEAGIDEYFYDDDDAFKHLYACDMISFLDNLPDSIVKDILIESLIYLMPEEYMEKFIKLLKEDEDLTQPELAK